MRRPHSERFFDGLGGSAEGDEVAVSTVAGLLGFTGVSGDRRKTGSLRFAGARDQDQEEE